MKRVVLALAAVSVLGGCSLFGKGDKPKTPTIGERIPVLSAEASVQVDPALADVAVVLPPAVANDAWSQPGGNASHSMVHLALGTALGRAWAVDAGVGSETRVKLAAAPVMADGRIYVVDTTATLRAFSAADGSSVWTTRIGDPKDLRGGRSIWSGEYTGNRALLFGGGVSYHDGKVYATNGIGDAAAFDAATGNPIWRVRPGGPLRGAPTVTGEGVYVISQDNQLYALNPADGAVQWQAAAALETAGVLGAAAPAAAQGTIVAGFSSGELTAYRYENGRVLWQDALSRTTVSTVVGALSDIDAEPVIDNGRVYAVGQGGRMVALELNTGQRIWEINLAGISTPWVAGEWIFVVDDEARLFAVARATGKVKWMTQLPRWRDPEDKEGPISWVGPVLAGERLILASSRGHLANVSPLDGAIQSTVDTDDPVSLPLMVANSTLYVLHDSGRLTAWR